MGSTFLITAVNHAGEEPEQAKRWYENADFKNKMQTLFEGEPSGCLIVPTLQDALERIVILEGQVGELEQRMLELEKKVSLTVS